MAVSRDGQHALLASRRLLVLVDLQRPDHHLRTLSWQSKYDAGSAAWSRAPAQSGADLAVTVSPPSPSLSLAVALAPAPASPLTFSPYHFTNCYMYTLHSSVHSDGGNAV